MRNYLFVLLLCATSLANADERILNYHSEILIKTNGWIEVTETIQVRAEGRQIRRGIYRDYPTNYEDRFGNDVQVVYEPRSVLRNDQREDFFSEDRRNGVRTYFGSADRMLDQGIHTYTYRYDANRMIGFFDDHDELYWNVTGLGWDFPIDNATASVSFEFSVARDELLLDGYSGPYGTQGQDFLARASASGQATFETTESLAPNAGLTIVVGWPKGLVEEPGGTQKLFWLLEDNLGLLIALGGLLAMLGYYIPVWRRFGKDPEPGVLFARYKPPAGFSPASLRYIEKMSYDDTTMTAAVISLAVKGYLRIYKDDDEHTLARVEAAGQAPELATGERELYDALFADGDTVVLDNKNHKRLGAARRAHRASLKFDYASRYFKTNGILNLPALLVGLVAAIVGLAVSGGPSMFLIATIVAMLITLITFAIIMKQPTGLGRKVLDESEGFREYLEIAEKDEMNLRNPPDKTPALFEKYLPFAMALGVEQAWADRFTNIFARIQGADSKGYQPSWYNGAWNGMNLTSSTSSLSSELGSAISSSVSPPGSSSGGGGGGFSGGGGGGGGGGGW